MPRKTTKPVAKPVAPTTDGGATGTTQASQPPTGEEDLAATLAQATGTRHAAFSAVLLNDVVAALGLPPDHPQREQRSAGAFGAMVGIAPADTVEGMMASHLATLHQGALRLLQAAAASNDGDRASRLRRDAMASMRVFNETLGALQQWRGEAARQHLVVERASVAEGANIAIGSTAEAEPRG